MDVLKLIESQIEEIYKEETSLFLELIFNHLNRADTYYQKGKEDPHYYNDVVYRTNQAFEGALKEAYKVLGNKTDEETAKKTPNDIEKYLKDNNIFKERVLKLFENYRQEWRNKSTHDYKLVLDEHEAFLALINVSSFVHMLLKQVQEKIAYNDEKAKNPNDIIKAQVETITSSQDDSITEKIVELLKIFSSESINHSDEFKEHETTIRLYAFLENINTGFNIKAEPAIPIGNSASVRPDFIIEHNGERIILEVRNRISYLTQNTGISQVIRYLQLTKLDTGILFIANSNRKEVLSSRHTIIEEDITYTVFVVS